MAVDPSASQYETVLVLLAEIRTDLKHALERTGDHETRIRALETARWKLAGFAAALGGAGGGVIFKLLGG